MRGAAIALALAALAGCASPVAPAGGGAWLRVRPRLAPPYALASLVEPWQKQHVAHLVLRLHRMASGTPVPVLDADGDPIAYDVTDPQTGGLERTYAFGPLRRNTRYRVTATAYDAAEAVISDDDAGSYAEVQVTDQDDPVIEPLDVHLSARPVGSRFLGPDFACEAGAAAAQTEPAAAAAGGKTLIAWAEAGDVYAMFRGGARFPVATDAGVQGAPAVAADAAGTRFLVAWESEGTTVRAVLLDAAGAVAAGPWSLAAGTGSQPAAAYSPATDDFLVVWRDDRDLATTGADVWGRRVAVAGTLAAPLAVHQGAGDQGRPAIAFQHRPDNPSLGRYLVVWEDAANAGDIGGQRVGTTGGPLLASAATICADPGEAPAFQGAPAVAYDGFAKEFLVAWTDARGGDRDVRAARFGLTLSPYGGDFALAGGTGDQDAPRLAWNPAAREYLAAWRDEQAGGARRLYAQRRNVPLSFVSSAFRVDAPTSDARALSGSAVAYDAAANELLLVWSDGRAAPGPALYARRLDSYIP